MNTSSSVPILYSFRRCPYAMRARMALYAAQIEVELREVVLRDKPQDMLEASPKGSVPVMILENGEVLEESLDIVLYALRQNDPYEFMTCDMALFDELIQENDSAFKKNLDRYKYPNRYPDEDTSSARNNGEEFLKKLNQILDGSTFLNSHKTSILDVCIFPFIRQFANTDRDWFDNTPYISLQKWLTFHLESALFKNIMPKHPQWKKGDTPIFMDVSPLEG